MRHPFLSVVLGMLFVLATANFAVRAAEPAPAETSAKVDRLLVEDVFARRSGVSLAPRTNDEVFLRRVYLDLVGQNPRPKAISEFVLDPSPNKRQQAVARLLEDPRYGVNWARYWRDVVMYRKSNAEGSFLAREPMEAYLTKAFTSNRPWDQIAREFVEAKGEINTNGQAGGVFLAQLTEPTEVASEISRIFLGVQIQCAQCHDHPTDRWKRQQFHEFAAFFPRVALRRGGMEIVSVDNGPETRQPGEFGASAKEHYMPNLKDPSSRGTLVKPVFFVTGEQLEIGATDDERRKSLAKWMTSSKNPQFAKAVVNRYWAELVGEGFYETIDDLGTDRECSAPKTMDYLAGQFVAHGYDIKWLLRTITGTAAYQRESRPRRLPTQPPFTANVPYQLRSDQLYDVVTAVIGFDPDAALLRQQQLTLQQQGARLSQGTRAQFTLLFGYDPSSRRDEITTSMPQALMMMNSPLVNRTMKAREVGTDLHKLLNSTPDDKKTTVELYLHCLAREPNKQELATCLEFVRTAGNRSDAFEDLLWSLMNSKEFMQRR